MSSEQYGTARYPWSSVSPAALSALDLGDVSSRDFRPTNWWGRSDSIFEQEYENDLAYLAFADQASMDNLVLTQPVVKWRVGRPADLNTTNDIAIAVADLPGGGTAGYISLANSVQVGHNTLIHFIDFGVVVRVLDVDDDNSEGWTNDASTACNVKCERLSGPAVAIASGTIAQIGSVIMGEEGVPGPGYTTTPGDPVWNTMQLVGIYGSITRVQMNTDMIGGWGTHPKIRDEVYFQHRLRKQNDMLFGKRYYGTDSEGAQGQLWLSSGVVDQVKTNILNAGALGVSLTGPKLNDFLENTFDSELSSPTKDWFCGSAQFRDVRKAAMQGEALTMVELPGLRSGTKDPGTLGANMMTIQLQSGKTVRVHELRKAFGAANLTDWGVVIDPANIGFASFKGISEVWYNNIEDPAQQITRQTDGLVDTWCTMVKDESTCAIVRGGTRSLVER